MEPSRHTVHITGYNSKGEGVARLDSGKVVFIRGAARGDVCEITVTEEGVRSCRASIAAIVQESPHRVPPDCPAYPVCGGCDFRHITYEEELWAKLSRVNEALSRIGKASLRADEVLTTEQIDGYRNKAVFHHSCNNGEAVVGFYSAGSHEICPVRHCLLLPDELNEKLAGIWQSPPQSTQTTFRAGNRDGSASVMYELDGLAFAVSNESFFQVNNEAAILLYSKARMLASLSGSDVFADLYCGVGASTLFVGRDASYAVGVEQNPIAIQDAIGNAEQNKMAHIEFICADAACWDPGKLRPDCVVVDPPRSGLSRTAVKKLLSLAPSRIVYISCDPATMARDIKLLGSYTPKRVYAIDMFPRTANVECCVLLERS